MNLLQLIGLIFLEFNLRVHRFFRAKTTAITLSDVARRSNRLLEAIEGVRVVRLGSEPSRSNQLHLISIGAEIFSDTRDSRADSLSLFSIFFDFSLIRNQVI